MHCGKEAPTLTRDLRERIRVGGVLSVVALGSNIYRHAIGMRVGRLAYCIDSCIGMYSVTVTDT